MFNEGLARLPSILVEVIQVAEEAYAGKIDGSRPSMYIHEEEAAT